jgi:hypothetical protein
MLRFCILSITLCFISGISYGNQSESRQSARSEDHVKHELFGELDRLFEKARSEKVDILSPENFVEASELYQEAVQDYQKGGKLKNIKENLEAAEQSLNEAFEASRLSNIVLENLIKFRQEVIERQTRSLANREFLDAEKIFREAAISVEKGNVKKAKSLVLKAENAYREAVLEALKAGPLYNAKKQLKENKKFISKEEYQKSEQLIDNAESTFKSISKTEFTVSGLWEPVSQKISDAARVQIEGLKLILPEILIMDGFRLEVLEYTNVSNSKLSGKADGYFLTLPCSSGQQNLLWTPKIYSQSNFVVEFNNLEIGNWPANKIEKVVNGKIEQTFDPMVECIVSDFYVNIKKLILKTDSSKAEIILSLPPMAMSKPTGCEKAKIGPALVDIDSTCNIYADLPDYSADSLLIGNTGILTKVQGVKIDFKNSPKKVVFKSGRTLLQKPFYSNTGYLLGEYVFSKGKIIECKGFQANLSLDKSLIFSSLIPLDFRLNLNSGKLEIEKSWIKKGSYSGEVTLPKSVKNSLGDIISVNLVSADVDSQLNFSGRVAFDRNQDISWGGFSLVTDSAYLYLPSSENAFSPAPLDTIITDTLKEMASSKIKPVLKTLPGLSFELFEPKAGDIFTVKTPDSKAPLNFTLQKAQLTGWFNIACKGITGELQSREEIKIMDVKLGFPGEKDYKSNSPFTANIYHQKDSLLWVNFKFIRNAAFDSYIGGYLDIPYPCDLKSPKYKDMEVTSTAELVGGDVFFDSDTLAYWGVEMTAEKTGNVLSVDLGEIIYMNSAIEEEVHFTKPFRIIWGEMFADGGLGKFLFDYNSAGQRFDGFPFTLHIAALSQYDKSIPPNSEKLGYLRAKGNVHFDFFGAKLMDIHDYKYQGKDPKKIYNKRIVFLDKTNSDLDFNKNWANKTAQMVFTVGYDQIDQNGFKGLTNKMKVDLDLKVTSMNSVQKLIPITIDLNSGISFIHFCKSGNLKLLSFGAGMDNIGGVIQIQGDAIKRIYLEGQASIKEWDLEQNTLASVEITPNNITLSYRGQLTFDTYGFGILGMVATRFVIDKKNSSLDGDISGVFRAYTGGFNLAEVVQTADYFNMEARGRLNFHVGTDANYLQGYARIKIKWGVAVECEGAFFIGYNAPTKKIWALDKITRGPSIRSIIADGMGTKTLSGFYFAGLFGYDIDFTIISGGIKLWAGVGFFQEGTATTFLGHGGAELHGKLLGGVVSASVWAELLASHKINPLKISDFHMCLQGTVGIEVCALVVFCVSIDEEFHVDDETGIGLDGCYQ